MWEIEDGVLKKPSEYFHHILDNYGVLPRRQLSDRTFFKKIANFEVYVVVHLNSYFIMVLNGKYRDLMI